MIFGLKVAPKKVIFCSIILPFYCEDTPEQKTKFSKFDRKGNKITKHYFDLWLNRFLQKLESGYLALLTMIVLWRI